MAKLKRIPTVIHEQNAVAGQVNQISSLFVNRVLSHFPNTLSKEEVVGNPVRAMDGVDLSLESLKARWSQRSGPLRLLVLGGSLGAQALNEIIPKALAEIEQDKRPMVRHQSGASHLSQLQINYQTVGVEGQCEAFIDDTLTAMQDADLLISRAGATTVAEIAALGIPSLLVPFPHAVDDHQTKNAQQLVENGAAWLVQQKNLTIEGLVAFLVSLDREKLQERAIKAYELGHRDATVRVADIVETLIKHHLPNKM
jgi:UDP-N-acetylglucosamine--N-acetylmuramyl-(pentapeptide) pyrophosphoryl-undecaprenol N-acetylglucosamine transferase